MPPVQGRIWFPGNPWPGGHRLIDCAWSGRIDAAGNLWFDFSVRTGEYEDDGDPVQSDDSDWAAPIAWNNYHSCTLSSMDWEDATGIRAATPGRPFRFDDPRPQRLTADPLPIVDIDARPAFHIYLLGHDEVADHELELTRQDGDGFQLVWTGAIALTYAGDDEYRYRFRVEASGVSFAGIDIPDQMSDDEARAALARVVDVPDRFVLSPAQGRLRVLRLEQEVSR